MKVCCVHFAPDFQKMVRPAVGVSDHKNLGNPNAPSPFKTGEAHFTHTSEFLKALIEWADRSPLRCAFQLLLYTFQLPHVGKLVHDFFRGCCLRWR